MSFNRQDLRNVIVLVVAQALTAGIGIVTFLRYAALLPVAEVGRLSFVIASTLIFGLLGELGVRYVVMRDVALGPEQAKRIFWHSVAVRWLLSVISMAALFVFTGLIQPWQGERSLLFLAGVVAVTAFVADPATWILYGYGRGDSVGVLLIVDRVFYMAATLAAASIFRNAESIILAELVTNLLRAFISWIRIRPLLASAAASLWDWGLFKHLIITGAAQGAALISYVLYSRLTIVVMQSSASEEALGYFSFAFDLITLVLFVPSALLAALYPTLARASQDNSAIRSLHSQIAWFVMLALVPLAVGLFLFADSAVTLMVGARYAPSVAVARILAVSVLGSGFSIMYRQFFFALNKPLPSTLIDVMGVGALLLLGVPIARDYGGLGIASLFVVLEMLLVTLRMIVARRWLGAPRYLFLFVRCLVACLLPGVVAIVVTELFFVQIVLYGLGAVACMLVLRVITVRQLRELEAGVRRMVGNILRPNPTS